MNATAPSLRQPVIRPHHAEAARPLLAIGGSTISLFGVVLAIVSFSTVDGSDFFLLAGLGLIVSGALLARRHVAGLWTYIAVFCATLTWSLDGAGLGGSPVGYRIAGPIIMLAMIALLVPPLLRWSRRRTVVALAVLIMATVMVGDLSSIDDGSPARPNLVISKFHEARTNRALQ